MAQMQSPHSPTGPGIPPGYDPRYSYGVPPQQVSPYQMVSPDPNTGAFGTPSPVFPSPSSPDPVKMAGGTSPVQFQQQAVPPQQLNEAPATNPVGIGNNRAELA